MSILNKLEKYVKETEEHDKIVSKLRDKISNISELILSTKDEELVDNLNQIKKYLDIKNKEYSKTDINLIDAIEDLDNNLGNNKSDSAMKLKEIIKHIVGKEN